jgi:hypothetical protein
MIRKIAVGPDYKEAMHYVVGQSVVDGRYTIEAILHNRDESQYEIWVRDSDGVRKWKSFNQHTPVHIEYKTNY